MKYSLRKEPWLALLIVGSMSGCVFFDSSYDDCYDNEDPELCPVGAGGDAGEGGGRMGGSDAGSGSSSNAGGHSGGEHDGVGGIGAEASGGRSSTGGGPDSGGKGSGGTGRDSGGSSSGGDNDGSGGDESSGGSGGSADVSFAKRLRVNEVVRTSSGFVELFNPSNREISLSGIHLVVSQSDGDIESSCELSDFGSVASQGVALVQSGPEPCLGGSECVADCGFAVGSDDLVLIVADPESTAMPLVSFQYPNSLTMGYPDSASSWASLPDGSDEYSSSHPSPGSANPFE